MSKKHPGRPRLHDGRMIRKTVYIPEDLSERIPDGEFSKRTVELWSAFLESDGLGIAELERERDELEAKKQGIIMRIDSKRKLQEKIKTLKIQQHVEELISAWVLRSFIVKDDLSGFKSWGPLNQQGDSDYGLYHIPAITKKKIIEDKASGIISPRSPLVVFQRYNFTIKDHDLKIRAREALIEELSGKKENEDPISFA